MKSFQYKQLHLIYHQQKRKYESEKAQEAEFQFMAGLNTLVEETARDKNELTSNGDGIRTA